MDLLINPQKTPWKELKYSHTISFCANRKDDLMTSKCSSDKQDDANFIQSTFGVELLQHSKPPFLNQGVFECQSTI